MRITRQLEEVTAVALKAKRYASIDGLRAYAAIGIVSMHVMTNGQYALPGPLRYLISPMGEFVYLFMAISAFSLCCGYYERFIKGSFSVGSFYGRRFAKLMPFFALLCLVDFIFQPSLDSLCEVFANVTLCFGLLPNPSMSVVGVGWFIGLVFVFYLVFPFFCFLLENQRRAWLAFAVALIYNVTCQLYFFDANHVVVGYDFRTNILFCSIFFIAGGLVYLYRPAEAEKAASSIRLLLLVVAALSFSLVAALGSNAFLLLLFVAALLAYAVIADEPSWLVNKFTIFISGISLEIYLCHMAVYRLLGKLLPVDHLPYAFALLLVLVGAVACSCAYKQLSRYLIAAFGDRCKNKASIKG